ncbi:MAG: hypothetical protein CMP67_07820 [Flavobacteriales bacterium]|nr:hypothetical protein [Flavobacteriales bacterium]|tara:strand:- start:5097 stop:7649 length:2553 start_codon:yes stop_codon:yes gene_type:complete
MKFLQFIFFFFISSIALATHNRAGEISFRQVGINEYEITLITYTRIETDADRPVIEINWGDGTIDSLSRSEGFPQFIAFDINKNEYKSTHTFPGPGTYNVSLEDPNRNADISNIPNSVNVPFYIESQIIINPFLGFNHSPILLTPPIEEACIDAVFLHNPSAFDEDGDSLVFSITEANGFGGDPIPGYVFPEGISINSNDGTLTWDKPASTGEFNLAILIEEYRDGFLIGSMVRDMQVSVKNCDNTPPSIVDIQNLCVEAGTSMDFEIMATDNDIDQTITLTATGGPISEVTGELAVFSEVLGEDTVTGSFKWNTSCSHVRQSPYQILFKAQDNDSEVQLIDLFTLNITVVASKVENVVAQSQTEGILVTWTKSFCEEAIGYEIYRKNDSLNWFPDSCETGVPSYTGYSLIGYNTGLDNTQFLDENAIEGNLYCYRIVAVFPDGAKSISSEKSCAETTQTSPIPTHVDVIVTDSILGEVLITWKKPKDLDSLNSTGILYYKVYETNEFQPPNLIHTSLNFFDTTFLHKNLNTISFQKNYYIELIEDVNGSENLLSTSETASSVFLITAPADQTVFLSWNFVTPWSNDTTVILLNENGIWESIDTVTGNSFVHKNLINGETYCYKVMTIGEYTSNLSDTFLLNHSQEKCDIPEDIIPPCVPEIISLSNCEITQNQFSWNLDTVNCNSDLTLLKIFFKRYPEDEYSLLYVESNPWNDSVYTQTELIEVAGCYSFSAEDSVGNESELSQEICFDNCPFYQLPNVFSPNGDNLNEFVTPFPYKYVEEVNFKIYNRWGQLVYETKSPDIKWNGINSLTNLPCASGVYFYSCIVKEKRLNGLENRIVNGFIQLIRD